MGSAASFPIYLPPYMLLVLSLIALPACGLITPKENGAESTQIAALTENPLTPQESEELLGEVGRNFVYGEGVGCSIISLGTVAFFPPYAALLLGNAALAMNGYEEIWPSDLLPDKESKDWKSAYSGVCSVPGRINAELAGENFRSNDEVNLRIEKFLRDRQSEHNKSRFKGSASADGVGDGTQAGREVSG